MTLFSRFGEALVRHRVDTHPHYQQTGDDRLVAEYERLMHDLTVTKAASDCRRQVQRRFDTVKGCPRGTQEQLADRLGTSHSQIPSGRAKRYLVAFELAAPRPDQTR